MDDRVSSYSWEGLPNSASGPQADEPGGLDLRQYLGVLFKFKWGILSVGLLAGLMGLYSAYKAVPIFSSTATLQIERDQGPMIGDLLRGQIFQFEFYQTQYELIRSWGVAEIAAARLGLLDADHLEGTTGAGTTGKGLTGAGVAGAGATGEGATGEAKPGAATSAASPRAGFSWRALIPDFLRPHVPQLTPEIRRANLIAGVQGSLVVTPVERSELTRISVQHPDPQWAARVANTVAESYIDFLRDKNLSEITGSQSWYSSRLVQARSDLEDAEQALQDYLDRQGLIQTAQGVDALQSQALQLALTNREDARQQKLALERLHREIQSAASPLQLETITALEQRGIVRQLKNSRADARRLASQMAERYGPRHPRMLEAQSALASAEQAYQDELNVVAEAVVADYQRAVRTEASYTGQLNQAQADIQALNRGRAELTKLQDDVATSRNLFEQLQSGEKTAGLMEGGQQNINATVIEFARPGLYPVRPDKQRMVLFWALGGLFVGIGLAFLLEQLDNTFKGSEDVERRLGLPVLGQLPTLKVARDAQLAPMSHFVDASRSAFAEAIRTIRTGVMLSLLDHEHSIITVTSSVPGEGKTTLAINLAHAIAQTRKTLLIDADMRRPMVHRAKNIGQPRPGLSALMTGEATFEEAHEEAEDGLHIIPAGTVPPNPLELLSSKRFRDLLHGLQETYEVIIIDSAPALAVSDALVVAQLADAQLYVIRADATPYQAAEQGIKRLRRVNAPLLGCVLNQVASTGRAYGYGKLGKYGRYYRYFQAGRYGRYGRYGYGRYSEYHPDQYHEYYAPETEHKA